MNEEIGREDFDFFGFPSETDNYITISFKNVSNPMKPRLPHLRRYFRLKSFPITI